MSSQNNGARRSVYALGMFILMSPSHPVAGAPELPRYDVVQLRHASDPDLTTPYLDGAGDVVIRDDTDISFYPANGGHPRRLGRVHNPNSNAELSVDGIGANGVIYGNSTTVTDGAWLFWTATPVVWHGKREIAVQPAPTMDMVDISGIDVHGTVVITASTECPDPFSDVSYIYSLTGKHLLKIADHADASAVSPDGRILIGHCEYAGDDVPPQPGRYGIWLEGQEHSIDLPHRDYDHTVNIAGMNDAGEVVGSVNDADAGSDHTWRSFAWCNGKLAWLPGFDGSLPGNVGARGLNAAGDVVGSVYTGTPVALRAFLYRNDQMVDLNDCITRSRDLTLTGAVSINDRGYILAYGDHGAIYLLKPRKQHLPA